MNVLFQQKKDYGKNIKKSIHNTQHFSKKLQHKIFEKKTYVKKGKSRSQKNFENEYFLQVCRGHPFRFSRIFPSTCHQGSVQYSKRRKGYHE